MKDLRTQREPQLRGTSHARWMNGAGAGYRNSIHTGHGGGRLSRLLPAPPFPKDGQTLDARGKQAHPAAHRGSAADHGAHRRMLGEEGRRFC